MLATATDEHLSGGPPPRSGRRLASWSSPHLIALTLVLGSAVFALAPPADPDVWWHVRTGDWILAHHALPNTDPWSLAASGREWIAHAWGAEVLLSLLHKVFGLTGISLYRCAGVLALLSALAIQSFRRTTPGRALWVTTLAVFATFGGWGERPQLLTFLLLVPAAQLVRAAVEGRRSIWWAVPLTFLWANLHGLWILAPVLVALGALGAYLEPRDLSRLRAARPFAVAALACVTVAAFTPNGPVILLQPLRVNGYGQFVSEWGPVDIHSVWGLGFFAMVLTLLFAFGRRTTRVSGYVLAQVSFAILLGLLYTRTVAAAAVLLTPLVADALGALPASARRRQLAAGFTRVCAGSLVTLGLAGGIVVLTALPDLPPAAPVAATRALVAATGGEEPRVLNEYGIGGWLLLYAPTAHPAIDGRAEIYPLSYVRDYIAALKLSGDWQRTITPLRANVALLHPTTPLVNGLRDTLGWTAVYEDENWLVLVPPSPVPA